MSPKLQGQSCQSPIDELRTVLEERKPDFEAYLIIVQKGRIDIGFLERIWYIKEFDENRIIYEIPVLNIWDYRVYPIRRFDPWLDSSRRRAEDEMRTIVLGGVFEVLTAVHFPFRKESIMDYQLSWMRQRRRRPMRQ